jgi:hypothetical protein
MRPLICLAIVCALVGLAGCGNQAAEQAEESQAPAAAQEDAQPIASEDFESGDTEHVVGSETEAEEGDDSGETP